MNGDAVDRLPLSFPFALREGELIQVADYQTGDVATCPGCGDPMLARRGNQIRHHFAHQPDSQCSPETALHKIAKLAIHQAFLRHRASETPYSLRWKCGNCDSPREADISKLAGECHEELTLQFGPRPDLLFRGKRDFVVEVVVTHAPDTDTLAKFEAEDLPVFEVHPPRNTNTSEWLEGLLEAVPVSAVHFAGSQGCGTCQARSANLERARTIFEKLHPITPGSGPERAVVPWEKNSNGWRLQGRAREGILRNARIVAQLGFKQCESTPSSFTLDVSNYQLGADFSDCDWEDMQPWIGWTRPTWVTDFDWKQSRPEHFGLWWALVEVYKTLGFEPADSMDMEQTARQVLGIEPNWKAESIFDLLPCPFL